MVASASRRHGWAVGRTGAARATGTGGAPRRAGAGRAERRPGRAGSARGHGAALRGVAVTTPSANAACAAAMVGVKATVAAGSHTVALQWRVGSGPATLRVRPAGNAEREHATLLVYEAT